MKRKLLSGLAALALLFGLTALPVGAEGNVAKIGDTEYATLQDAVNAVAQSASKTGTIQMQGDSNEDVTISEKTTVTLDLNGCTLTNVSGDTLTVKLGATLNVVGTGTVDNITHQKAAIVNNGTVTLSGGNYTRSKEASTSINDANGNSYYNILNHGVMTINEGVTVSSTGSFSSLIDNGYYNYSDKDSGDRIAYIEGTNQETVTLTINGGTFAGGINTIKNDDAATVTINDGKFSNVTQAVIYNANKAVITGGTFNVSADNASGMYAVYNLNYDSGVNIVDTQITGGEFVGALYDSQKSKLSISGGTFTSDVSAYLPENDQYIQDENGKVVILDETNSEAKIGSTYYLTLQAAVEALQSGDTLDILKDVEVDEEVYIWKKDNVTINGNGHTITAADGFTVNEHGQIQLMKVQSENVTLNDLTLVGTEKTKHTLDVWGADGLKLNNVSLDHENAQPGAPLIINGSAVTVTGDFKVVTGPNSWYGINLDNKNAPASLTFAKDSNIAFTDNSGKDLPFAYIENTAGEKDNGYNTGLPTVTDESGRLGDLDATNGAVAFHLHNISTEWTVTEDGHYHLCMEGGEQHDYAAHTSDGGVVTTEATTDHAGVRTYSCTVCGKVLGTETIPQIDAHPEIGAAIKDGTWGKTQPTPAPTAKPAAAAKPAAGTTIPQTGDNANPALWVVVMVAALLGFAGVCVARRGKKD